MHPVSRILCAGTALVWLGCAATAPAAAIEVECIEASKYKYLWQIFGNDPGKLAQYLATDPAKLPGPELCRAVLVSGGIAPKAEVDKLIDAIAANRGWLATVYLASSGGSVNEGRRLAEVVRMFWLKTYSVLLLPQLPFAYQPDFALAPLGTWAPRGSGSPSNSPSDTPAFAAGWQAYGKVVENLPKPGKDGASRCSSACSMLFAAGVDRQGIVYVHRPRYSSTEKSKDSKDAGLDLSRSMADTLEGLQRSEQLQVLLYQQMDAGDEFIRIYQSTPTNIVSPATGARTPRYVADLLLERCGSNAAQLQDLDTQLRTAILEVNAKTGGYVDTERLRRALATVHQRRVLVEQCVAAAHEKERLVIFAKLCGQSCNHSKLNATIDQRLREITPEAKSK